MLLTKASEYALLSLVIISKSNKPKSVTELSIELNISKSFLAKVLQQLSRSNILNSFKGINGGFSLNKEPKEITIYEIIDSIEDNAYIFECSNSQESCKDGKGSCTIWPFLNNFQNLVDNFLKDLSLDDVINCKAVIGKQ